jgi:hypothetical protein
MTIRSNPNRGNQDEREAFIKQAAADTTRLHCFIPTGLHHQLKLRAVEERTNVTSLVVEALENYVAERR